MKPSTTARETSSRLPMRASTTGSMKRAPGIAWISTAMSHTRARERNDLEQPIDDLVGRHAFGLRVEVGDDAVAHDRVRQRADVLEADVIAAARQRARLAAEHQILRRADAGAERDPLLDEVLRRRILRAAGAHEIEGVPHDRLGD